MIGMLAGMSVVALGGTFVLALVVAALVPASTRGLKSRPNPVAEYDDAVAEIERMIARDAGIVRRACRSTLLTHNKKTARVVVCFHGLTDSPLQFSAFGTAIFETGANVVAIRLPYHGLGGAEVGGLSRLDATAYCDYADKTIDLAHGLGEEVDVIGVSAGGVVAAWVGQNRSDVRRSIAVAPALGAAAGPSFGSAGIANLSTKVRSLELLWGPSIELVHSGMPLGALAETFRLGKAVTLASQDSAPAAESRTCISICPTDSSTSRPCSCACSGFRWAGRPSVSTR
jgi:pimeloyl-ACP methyl ester carboxylesterase